MQKILSYLKLKRPSSAQTWADTKEHKSMQYKTAR